MFNKLKKAKNTTKKETKRVIKEDTKRTEKDREAFVRDVSKCIHKHFDTKGPLNATIVLATSDNKNIAVAAGDEDKAFAIIYELIKHLDETKRGVLCALIMETLGPSAMLATTISSLAMKAGSSEPKKKKGTLH